MNGWLEYLYLWVSCAGQRGKRASERAADELKAAGNGGEHDEEPRVRGGGVMGGDQRGKRKELAAGNDGGSSRSAVAAGAENGRGSDDVRAAAGLCGGEGAEVHGVGLRKDQRDERWERGSGAGANWYI